MSDDKCNYYSHDSCFLIFFSTFRVYDILCDLFAERMPQDTSYKYKPDTVNVYFENRINATIHKVDVQKTIKEITADKKYVLVASICSKNDFLGIFLNNNFFIYVSYYSFLVGMGVLTFHVVTKGSEAEKRFMAKERTRLNITAF